ncbi:MAG: flippase-like domain-containing protein [Deltaproteobacteria bacterium]|nr:flippase-like domain-containing protein [Deltaproteobacteria bacterium]
MISGVPRKRFWLAAVIGVTIFLLTLRQADLKRLGENITQINVAWGFFAILASALSYLCIAAVLHRLLRGTGHALSFSNTFKISLLSCSMNYVMAIAGLSGVAAKVYLLAREKIPPSKTLSISIIHGFFTNTVAVIFIYLGFFFLYSEYKMSLREIEVGAVILLLAFLLTWVTIQTILHEAFRKKLWHVCMGIAAKTCEGLRKPHWINRERAQAFFDNFNESMNLIAGNRGILMVPALYALFDWLLMFLCLKFSFLALHYPVDNSSLLVGFSVGVFTSLFSLTPASIGLMEGTMAGSFYLMGMDFERALVATLLYRFAYYFLPIVLSFFFYRRFFPASDQQVQMEKRYETR